MQSIFVCNTANDSLSEINLIDYKVISYPLELGNKPVGPSGIVCYEDKLIIGNCYNNSISVFSLIEKKEIANIYAGAYPNDLKLFNNKIYVACGESNSLAVIDLEEETLILSIPLGENPYNIEIDYENEIAYISNFKSNSISILDLKEGKVIGDLKTYENPTKVFLSKDKKILYLCESNMGKDVEGYITLISVENRKVLKRIRAGSSPVDFIVEDNNIYVLSLDEGNLRIIDNNSGKEIRKIYVGGMPSTIMKKSDDIFILDSMDSRVLKINLNEGIIKNITVGKEPSAMILADRLL